MTDRPLDWVRIGVGLMIVAAIGFMIWTLINESVFDARSFFTFGRPRRCGPRRADGGLS